MRERWEVHGGGGKKVNVLMVDPAVFATIYSGELELRVDLESSIRRCQAVS